MPFRNEHSIRITKPNYSKYARKTLTAGVDAVLGIRGGKSEVQALRFDKDKFSIEEAKAWASKHGYTKPLEVAKAKEHSDGVSAPAGPSAITVPTALRNQSIQYKFNEEEDPMEMESDELIDFMLEHPEIPLEVIKKGMEHELEHTDDKEIALKVAVDHFKEYGAGYYKKLEEVFDHASDNKETKDIEDDIDEEDEEELGFSEDDRELTVEAFSAGTHTDANGQTAEWSEADLDDIAKKGNEQMQKKPIPVCIGHPTDSSPAYGWVKRFVVAGKKLVAKVGELNPAFVDALKSGTFKQRSISLYNDNRVRHLGFLGAAQAAVEGLKPFSFADAEPFKTYSFSEENDMESIIIDQKDLNFLQKLLKKFMSKEKLMDKEFKENDPKVEAKAEIKTEAVAETKDHREAQSVVAQEIGKAMTAETSKDAIQASIVAKETKDDGVQKTSKIQAAEAKNDANKTQDENNELKQKIQMLEAELAAIKATMGKKDAEKSTADNASFCEQLIRDGKIRPVDRDVTLLTLNTMSDLDKVAEFSEATPGTTGGVVGKDNLKKYKERLTGLAKVVEFGEFPNLPAAESAASFPNANLDMGEIIERKMKEKQDKLGLTDKVSYWDMLKACHAECQKEYPEKYKEYASKMIPMAVQ